MKVKEIFESVMLNAARMEHFDSIISTLWSRLCKITFEFTLK